MKLTHRLNKMLAVAALSGAALGMSAVDAEASITFTLMEVGDDVVVSSPGGSLDLSAWNIGPGLSGSGSYIFPSMGFVGFGGGVFDVYRAPVNFVSDGPFGNGSFSSASSEMATDLYGLASQFGETAIYVPLGYMSNATLAGGSMTFANQDYSTLGITPGVYTYSWGFQDIPGIAPTIAPLDIEHEQCQPAVPYDFIRLDIKPPSVPDGGTTALLGLLAFGGLGFLRRFMK